MITSKSFLPILLAAAITFCLPAASLAQRGGGGHSGGHSSGFSGASRGYSGGQHFGGQAYSGARGYAAPAYRGGGAYNRGYGRSYGPGYYGRGYYGGGYYGGFGLGLGFYGSPYYYGPGYGYYAPAPVPACNPAGYYDQAGNWIPYPGCASSGYGY